MFEIKFFTLLVFIIVNFIVILFVKTRTTIVISLIISHLIAILLFSNIISSYEIFKEMILSLSIYSISLLFLISNYNQNNLNPEEAKKIKDRKQSSIIFLATVFIIFTVFLGMFFISKNILLVKREITNKTLVTVEIKENNEKNKIDKLSDNFLLKKSSDIILLIVATSSILLVLLKKES